MYAKIHVLLKGFKMLYSDMEKIFSADQQLGIDLSVYSTTRKFRAIGMNKSYDDIRPLKAENYTADEELGHHVIQYMFGNEVLLKCNREITPPVKDKVKTAKKKNVPTSKIKAVVNSVLDDFKF